MGVTHIYNDNLRKLPNEYGDVSIMKNKQHFFFLHRLNIMQNVLRVTSLCQQVKKQTKKLKLTKLLKKNNKELNF